MTDERAVRLALALAREKAENARLRELLAASATSDIQSIAWDTCGQRENGPRLVTGALTATTETES